MKQINFKEFYILIKERYNNLNNQLYDLSNQLYVISYLFLIILIYLLKFIFNDFIVIQFWNNLTLHKIFYIMIFLCTFQILFKLYKVSKDGVNVK